jgi:cobaltochelatase CobN
MADTPRAETYRQRVVRADGRTINVVQRRAHLSYCLTGCCCGRTERGYAAVPVDTYKDEWLRRKLRNIVHLTKGGCLGPCALANVASLVFDSRAVWFHSINTPWHVRLIFDYIQSMVDADRFLAPPPELAEYAFNYYDWDTRPRITSERSAARHASPSGAAAGAGGDDDGPAIALLSHADTDLLTLRRGREALPPDLRVTGLSLLGLQTDEQMALLLDDGGALARARIILLRLHGDLSSVAGFDRLRRHCLDSGQHLAIVSGTGEPRADFARAGTVPLDLLDAVTTYFVLGGERNVTECLKFLADRLLLTGHGSSPPLAVPEHGIYLRDVEDATIDDWRQRADPLRPTAVVLFYRAHLLSGNTAFVDALVEALDAKGLNALPVFTSSLRAMDGDRPAAWRLFDGHADVNVDVIVSTLSFAVGETPGAEPSDVPVVQVIASGMARGAWEVSRRGLTALETAINVAIPEFDGRIIAPPISFKDRTGEGAGLYAPHPERMERAAGIAASIARLRHLPVSQARVAFVLTNSSSKASQIGNAVGLDAPASLLALLQAMTARGYAIADLPFSSDELMTRLLARGSYDEAHPLDPWLAQRWARVHYRAAFERLPEAARRRMDEWWGTPGDRGHTLRSTARKIDKKIASGLASKSVVLDEEPWSDDEDYWFAALEFGNAIVALQPPRGYGMDPDAIYHTPDLPPTHHYTAFYRWLAAPRADGGWGADAIVHVGKHGTLEWLPGKGIGLSGECYPDALLGDLPLIYPFIVNDPGEGSQAKRRAHAVIVDHLMPGMTNAETYGPLATLNELVNEYYTLEKLDPSKLPLLQQQIWELIQQANLQTDLDLRTILSRDHGDHKHDWDDEVTPEGVPVTLAEMSGSDVAHLIEDLDGYLCELGTAQIRDGLHTLGELPALPDTMRALTRLSNAGTPGLQAAIIAGFSAGLGLDSGFELHALLAAPGARLDAPREIRDVVCHTNGDVLERGEGLSHDLFARLEREGFRASTVRAIQEELLGFVSDDVGAALTFACETLVPALERVTDEVEHVIDALGGRHVPAGPSGAPTRGMAHILPTGRNFYSVDPRALPSQAAWRVGQQLAREVLDRHLVEEGRYPEMIGLGAWGTSQMRTQGDDIAEVLALLGVVPVWDSRSRRVQDLALIPLERLGRPRIDVTLRISGFFRDAFPHLITLVDRAVELVTQADEPIDRNYPRKHYLAEIAQQGDSVGVEEAEANARYRIFGAKPGTYGAGIQALLETRHWETDQDFAQVFLEWGGYAYGREADGVDARATFARRLRTVEVAVHNQDNREHDIFDSDDYYQFHGGMIATVRALTGQQPKAYFGDTSRPDMARVRDLREEALRVYRSRVVNPKWLESIRRHGYKGGLELAATVDYVFGFDATAHVAPDFVYEGLAEHYALSAEMREFLARANPWALHAIAERLLEAAERGLWEQPDAATLEALRDVRMDAETMVEARGERARESK